MQIKQKYFGPCHSALEYFSRGNFKKLIEDYEGAIGDYNNAIALRPIFWEAYFQRGNAFSHLKNEQRAFSDFNKAIDLILKYY